MIMDDVDASCKQALPETGEGQQLFGVDILGLRYFSCRYIIGSDDERGAIFCGQEVHRVSYCKAHYRLCYLPPKKPPVLVSAPR
jgi:hypothetical protein